MATTARKFERQLPEARRQALVEATLACLAKQGHGGLSIRRISEAAGVSVGLINHHFPSKTALVAEAYRALDNRLAAVFAGALEHFPTEWKPVGRKKVLKTNTLEHRSGSIRSNSALAAVPAGSSTARQQLDRYIEASFSAPNLDPDILHIWVVFWSLSRHTPEIREVREATYAASLARLEALVAAAMREVGRKPKSAHLAAIGLTALLDGLWLEWCLNPRTFTPAEGIKLAKAWADQMLRG